MSDHDRNDPERPRGVVILGGAHVSLGLARSLGRRGIPVWMLTDHPLAKVSRYVARSFFWPGAEHPDGLAMLLGIAARHNLAGWLLFPTGDEDMGMVAKNHSLLSTYFRLTSPEWETAKWLLNKRLTYERAAALGIDFPWSFHPESAEDVLRLDCRFPVILKPAARKSANEFTRAKAWKAEDRSALLALYKRAAALAGDDGVVIQEWIPGTGSSQFSYAGVWDGGVPVGSMVARRTRQFPIDFGRSSTFVETIEQSPVEEEACRAIAVTQLHGSGRGGV
jgi:D-aspartate ligase